MLAKDFWNTWAVPAVSPWMEIGTLILAMVFWMAAIAPSIDWPCGMLNEKVVATNGPWWFTARGVVHNDVDLGSGYNYAVLIEQATLAK